MNLKRYIVDSKMFEYDKHFRDCSQSNLPFIKARINPIHGNYHIQIDMMSCDYKFSETGLNKLKILFEKELEFAKLSNSRNKIEPYSITDELSWIDGIIPSRVNDFCELLYDYSQQYNK